MDSATLHRQQAKGRHPVSVILGLGRTGVSCARHLAQRGHELRVTDSRSAPPGLAELRSTCPEAGVALGGFDESLLAGADQVVISPGISMREPIVVAALNLGLDVVGDIELFAREAGGRTVGITGTNGKSTVTTLVGEIAEAARISVRVGGNIGRPALDLLVGEPAELYVLELSSFQLESTRSLALEAAVVLNVTADHFDRYSGMSDYGAAKARIYDNCATAVVNLDDELVRRMPRPGQRVVGFSLTRADADYSLQDISGSSWLVAGGEPVLPLSELRLSGRHNAANALAALALADACGLPRSAALSAFQHFPGLPHRTQWVADAAGVRWIDDSKATNVGAALAAVEGLAGPLVIIAGGEGKGQDFTPLANAFRGKVRRTVLIGRDARQLGAALEGACEVEFAASMEQAVAAARRAARPGDTVMLSPACASFDMFRDYAHRGEVFAAAARGGAA
jgi:UDP-N-acetylmuramoylalanine--D-glutamate ligase